MTKSPRKNMPDVGIELGAACMPSELPSDRATAPGAHCESWLQVSLRQSCRLVGMVPPGHMSDALQIGFAFGFLTHSLEMDECNGFSWLKPGM